MEWSIPSDRLAGRHQIGGSRAISGFSYQAGYACVELMRLLIEDSNLVAVRYEGAQDVDLLYNDGREEYIQLKNEPDKHYTLAELRPILQRFADNLLQANEKRTLHFILVARSNHLDSATKRLRDGNWESDPTTLISEIAKSTASDPLPPNLASLDTITLCNILHKTLAKTIFRFGSGGELYGESYFASRTQAELAKLGIAGDAVGGAYNALTAALVPGKVFTRADVYEMLKTFVAASTGESILGAPLDVLTDDLLSEKAPAQKILRYYIAEAPLSWDIISADGDIRRDQQETTLAQMAQPSDELRIFDITAETGAGKSTFAWRLAAELYRRHKSLVFRLLRPSEINSWYSMPKLYSKLRRPFYVLADDPYRDEEVTRAIAQLGSTLPITIIATSSASEYYPGRAQVVRTRVRLAPPSDEEKAEILHKLGKSRSSLTGEQQRRLEQANLFLVMMAEIVTGHNFADIVADGLDRLKRIDKVLWSAYEYVSFAYQYSVSVPSDLLERLDASGKFNGLLVRQAADGWLYPDYWIEGNVRAGHRLYAEIAFQRYGRSPSTVLRELVEAVDEDVAADRSFAIAIHMRLAKFASSLLQSAPETIIGKMRRCRKKGSIAQLAHWHCSYRKLGLVRLAVECMDLALSREPMSSDDCVHLLGCYRKRHREQDAYPIFVDWIKKGELSENAAACYLSLVKRYGTADDLGAAVSEAKEHLRGNPGSEQLWSALISCLLKLRKGDEAEQVAEEALRIFPFSQAIRMHRNRIVSQNKNLEAAVEDARKLAGDHPNDLVASLHYANQLRDSGSHEKAEDEYKSLINRSPRYYQAKYNYGVLLQQKADYSGAIDQLLAVLRIHRGHTTAIDRLAETYHLLARKLDQDGDAKASELYREKALEEYENAIYWADINNLGKAIFYTHLGLFHLQWKRHADAIAALNKASSLDPLYFGNDWRLGEALIGLGRYKEAKEHLLLALKKAPNDLGPPASEEIQELLIICAQALGTEEFN